MSEYIEKIKVIQIAHASHSYFFGDKNKHEDVDKIIIGSWFAQVARELKRFRKINIECWVPEKVYKKEKQFQDNDIKYRVFPTSFSPMYALDFSIPLLKALKQEILENNKKGIKTIIHLHEYHNLHGLAIAWLFKKQKIIGQHHGGSWPLKHLKQTRRYRLFFPFFMLGQIFENLFLKNIRYFYALSESELSYLKEKARNSKRIFQTMGIGEEYFEKLNKNLARKKLKISKEEKILLYIGRINEIKGIRYLIDAMAHLKDMRLKIIGFSQNVGEFEDYAKSKKLKNVEFLGGKFGREKILYLDAADALVLPSSKEGAPVTIIEALSRNLPVIASRVGGVPLMIDKEDGILINPRSTSDIIKAAREIIQWKPRNLQKDAGKYRWKSIIQETIKDYLE